MKTNFIFFGLLMMCCVGCTERIDLDLNTLENKRLIVDGWITTDTMAHEISLQYTQDFFDIEEAERVSGAQVSLFDGTQIIVFTETEPGIYTSPPSAYGVIGRWYELRIELNNEVFESTTRLDSVMAIDSLAYSRKDDFGRDLDTGDFGLPLYRLLFSGKELSGTGDHYAMRVFKNGILDTDTLFEYVLFNDEFVDGFEYNLISFDFIEAEINDTIEVELLSISKEAFEAYQAMFSEVFRGGIFDAPPANVPSNLINGALGVFNASAVSRRQIVIQ